VQQKRVAAWEWPLKENWLGAKEECFRWLRATPHRRSGFLRRPSSKPESPKFTAALSEMLEMRKGLGDKYFVMRSGVSCFGTTSAASWSTFLRVYVGNRRSLTPRSPTFALFSNGGRGLNVGASMVGGWRSSSGSPKRPCRSSRAFSTSLRALASGPRRPSSV